MRTETKKLDHPKDQGVGDQRIVPARFQPIDFLAMTGRFFVFGSGEGGYPGEVVEDAGDCHERLVQTLRDDCDDDDTGWIIDELRTRDNWQDDENGNPYWWSIDIGEISRLHVVRVADPLA